MTNFFIGDISFYPMSIYWFHIALGIVGCIFTRCKKTEGESETFSIIDQFKRK